MVSFLYQSEAPPDGCFPLKPVTRKPSLGAECGAQDVDLWRPNSAVPRSLKFEPRPLAFPSHPGSSNL